MTERALVIGAGLGGLAAALRLRARGAEVRLLESAPDAGGRARRFSFDGHQFDAGPTVITAPYLFAELFALFGKRIEDYVEIRPLNPVWYRFRFEDGGHCDYGPQPFFLEQIGEHFPAEIDNYRRLYAKAEEIFALGYERLADQPFHQPGAMLRYLPHIIRHQGYRSVYGLIARYIRSPQLRRMLATPPLLLGGNPKQASAIYFLIHVLEQRYGVHYAMGGTTALIDALLMLAHEEGIRIEYDKRVTSFDWQGRALRGVTCADSSYYTAETIVYNGDPTRLYQDLLPDHVQTRYTRWRRHHHTPSMGLLVIYFATSKHYPDIAHHTIGLSADYDRVLDDLFRRRQMPEGICYYLHRPAATDPNVSASGHELCYVLSLVPTPPHHELQHEEYQRQAARVMAHLDATILPGLRANMVLQEHIAPPYFAGTLHSAGGAGFSLAPTLTQSAWGRYHNRDGYFSNLYLVGAGTHPGAGLPGVLNSAKVMERLLP